MVVGGLLQAAVSNQIISFVEDAYFMHNFLYHMPTSFTFQIFCYLSANMQTILWLIAFCIALI